MKRERLWVACNKCSMRWVVAHLPSPLYLLAAELMAVRCPACGASSTYLHLAYPPLETVVDNDNEHSEDVTP